MRGELAYVIAALAFGTLAVVRATRDGYSAWGWLYPKRLSLSLALVGTALSATANATQAVLVAALLVCVLSDIKRGLIFDSVVLSAFVAIALGDVVARRGDAWVSGAVACAGALAILHLVTKRRGIGLGDVKLGLPIGAALGPLLGIEALGCAFGIGALWGIGALASRRCDRRDAIPFAPFMGAGVAAVLTCTSRLP